MGSMARDTEAKDPSEGAAQAEAGRERSLEPADPGDSEAGGRTFEQLMAELEEVTERLATGELGIEDAAELYERAQKLHAWATERLAQVQARVEALAKRS
jgi:exodeoxyribonuclease VII small subunit